MNIPNYKILKEIGAGGMGTVYVAEHTLIKRKVAIKSLNVNLIKNQQLRERFKKEATALAQLEHPNIVRLNEYIEQQMVLNTLLLKYKRQQKNIKLLLKNLFIREVLN